MELVSQWWKTDIIANPIETLFHKLKSVKKGLKQWNYEVYGNIFQRIKELENEVLETEIAMQVDLFSQAEGRLLEAKNQLNKYLSLEETYWCQRSQNGWMKEREILAFIMLMLRRGRRGDGS